MADAITDPAQLYALLGLDPAGIEAAFAAARGFPLRVPRGYAARMRRGDPRDPLLLQVLPAAAELVEAAGFGPDPVGDLASRSAPGLLQKYAGRSLLVATGACAVGIAATASGAISRMQTSLLYSRTGSPRSGNCAPTRASNC